MKKTLLLVVLAFSIIPFLNTLSAQSVYGINFNAASPQGVYAENVTTPMGLSFNYLHNNNKVKGLYYGVEFGVAMYASDEYDYDFNGKTIELSEEDCYLSYAGVVRYQFRQQKLLNPYVEGRVGGISYFSTIMSNDEDFENDTKFYGSSFSFGLGGGLAIHLCENMALDLGITKALSLIHI